MKRTKMIAASTLALAITIGGGVLASQSANAATVSQQQTQKGGGLSGHFGKRGGGFGGAFAASEDVASLLGMTTDELKTELQSGKTLAAIAGEKGIALQSLIDEQVAEMAAKLDKMLADGTMTQAQYDQRKADFIDKVTKLDNGELGPKGGFGGREGGPGGILAAGEDAAKLLGMTADELKTELQSGKSLAAIAGEKGVAVQSLIDLQVTDMKAKLDKQLADGKITQAQYDERAAKFADMATKMVNGEMGPKGGFGGREGGPGGVFAAGEDMAKLLGMTTDELKTALQSGKSLAAIAGEKGVAVQSLIDLQVTDMKAKLDKQLADGKITQAQYDERAAKFADMAAKMVNGEMGPKGGFGGREGGFSGMFAAGEDMAKLLGMTTDELKTALQSGKTLAAIAGEKGVAVQSLIDLQVQDMTAKLDKQLADGKITQAQYDERKAGLTDRATKMVNGEMGPKGGFGGHMRHGDEGAAGSSTDSGTSETGTIAAPETSA